MPEFEPKKISTFHMQYCQKTEKNNHINENLRENRVAVKNPISTFHL